MKVNVDDAKIKELYLVLSNMLDYSAKDVMKAVKPDALVNKMLDTAIKQAKEMQKGDLP